MDLVFVRHAHRDLSDRTLDNGLSEKGREQVEDLLGDLDNGSLPMANIFWTSPKQRCQETLKPLSEACDGKYVVEPLLDEQAPHENQKQFIERLDSLVKKVSKEKETVYLCSHGDVIPEVVNMLVGLQLELGKGEAVIVSRDDDGKWEIR